MVLLNDALKWRDEELWKSFDKAKAKAEKILKEASDHDLAVWALGKLQEHERKELLTFFAAERVSVPGSRASRGAPPQASKKIEPHVEKSLKPGVLHTRIGGKVEVAGG